MLRHETCFFTEMDNEFLIYPNLLKTSLERSRKEELQLCLFQICAQCAYNDHILWRSCLSEFVENFCKGCFTGRFHTANASEEFPKLVQNLYFFNFLKLKNVENDEVWKLLQFLQNTNCPNKKL